MKLFRVKSKLEKANRFKRLFEESLFELTGEVKKAFGEEYYATVVDGDGFVIASEETEENVCHLDMILTAIENGTYTEPENYGI